MQWWELSHWVTRSRVRSSLSADFAGGRFASVFPFPRPHSCGSLRHWVCPALFSLMFGKLELQILGMRSLISGRTSLGGKIFFNIFDLQITCICYTILCMLCSCVADTQRWTSASEASCKVDCIWISCLWLVTCFVFCVSTSFFSGVKLICSLFNMQALFRPFVISSSDLEHFGWLWYP